jgi:hypothetical protein
MTGRSEARGDGAAELGELLVLLHDVSSAFRSVEAAFVVWWHQSRVQEAFQAEAEARSRRGGSTSIGYGRVSSSREERQPDEREMTVRIWHDGRKVREEHHGGDRDGYYAVADPPLWWMWNENSGARSNQDDPSVGSGIGQEMELMLDPTPLLSSVRFVVTGRSATAGRPTITARATPRPVDERFGPSFGLGQLGIGADHYELEIDAQHGLLLESTAIRDGEPFRKITAMAITLDQPIAAETFKFEPPVGEEIQPTRGGPRMQNVTLVEAQQQTGFTVLMPDRVPENWQVQCRLIEPSNRPPSPPLVVVMYHSTDGHESISIHQRAADPAHLYEGRADEDGWEDLVDAGYAIKARPANWGQAQVLVERDGTSLYLMSDNLTRDQVVKIAVGMRPAPTTSRV